MNARDFLSRCQLSSQETYEALKEVLIHLEGFAKRTQALETIHSVSTQLMSQMNTQEMLTRYHLAFSKLSLQQEEGQKLQLTLLQLPSTFAPEEWSFTFYEGLARYKTSEFRDETIAELGCGIGWVSLALAMQHRPQKIYGLDINPKAILCSKINLFLNAFTSDHQPTWKHKNKTLLDFVEFHESDLLEHCQTHSIELDKVIGCIPQILSPDPEFTSKILKHQDEPTTHISSELSDDFLHSLSNYTTGQGYIEDQFGLGLIARAIEESVDVMKMSGKIILNLGGRPSTSVLTRLFTRRGLTVQPIWRTRVTQAKDTDIHSLAAIEDQTSHRFEFYLGFGSDTPVSAKTALAYAEAGGEIAHGLTVYESEIRDPAHLATILQFMRNNEYESARNSMDFSYPVISGDSPSDTLILEKLSFLHTLTTHLQGGSFFPYEHTAGTQSFRDHLASFFRKYFKIPLHPENFLITPTRTVACENILLTFKPKKALVDSSLAQSLRCEPNIDLLEIPRNIDLACDLIRKLKPEIAIYTFSPHEVETREPFLELIEMARQSSTRLFIDISELMDLSSTPKNNAIFRYLVKNTLPPHVTLFCGLVKNRIYRDLEVCFLISHHEPLLHHLESCAELTYSRTPFLSQLYYDRIVQDLIHFQVIETTSGNSPEQTPLIFERTDIQLSFIGLSKSATLAFSHPAIANETLARNPELIRMDYGENSLPSPKNLQNALFESFVKMQIDPEEADCTQVILNVARTRIQMSPHENLQVYLSCGVAPLFSKLCHECTATSSTLFFPTGAYGHFVASAQIQNTPIRLIQTHSQNHFKVTPQDLTEALTSVEGTPWVVLCAPLVNPTGVLYSASELEEIFALLEERQAVVILDTLFSGLEFSQTAQSTLADLSKFPQLRWVILGGTSKEFAAGGLRIGYGISSDTSIQELWKKSHLPQPHSTLKFTLKKLYTQLLEKDPSLINALDLQRNELRNRAEKLGTLLKENGWTVIPPEGGLFITAAPPTELPKSPSSDPSAKFHSDTWDELLIQKAKLVVNPPLWTGIPNHYRFVLSLPDAQFEAALERLKDLPLW